MTRIELFEIINYHCYNTPNFDRELFNNWYDVCIHIVKKTTNKIPDETIEKLAQWVTELIKEIA